MDIEEWKTHCTPRKLYYWRHFEWTQSVGVIRAIGLGGCESIFSGDATCTRLLVYSPDVMPSSGLF